MTQVRGKTHGVRVMTCTEYVGDDHGYGGALKRRHTHNVPPSNCFTGLISSLQDCTQYSTGGSFAKLQGADPGTQKPAFGWKRAEDDVILSLDFVPVDLRRAHVQSPPGL